MVALLLHGSCEVGQIDRFIVPMVGVLFVQGHLRDVVKEFLVKR